MSSVNEAGKLHEAPRSALFLIGTPAQCIEELNRRAKEWGVGQFIFLSDAPETTRRLANEVLPHVGP
jgi:alkanesulfonate monooxygenase SsuD/methylene tetrahydromethanopterin reductase-like flavin-dependent oxidoreductase (luciferase family)